MAVTQYATNQNDRLTGVQTIRTGYAIDLSPLDIS